MTCSYFPLEGEGRHSELEKLSQEAVPGSSESSKIHMVSPPPVHVENNYWVGGWGEALFGEVLKPSGKSAVVTHTRVCFLVMVLPRAIRAPRSDPLLGIY